MDYLSIKRLTWVLLLGVATQGALLAEPNRTTDLTTTDPNGFILTLTAVSVVFTALALLIVFFKCLGRVILYLSERNKVKSQGATLTPKPSCQGDALDAEVVVAISMALEATQAVPTGEAMAAIALSIEDYLSNSHDHETYRLTIKPRQTSWNNRSFGLRQNPH